jgi:hypothetical protein
MPPKHPVAPNKRETTDFKMPIKSDGTLDKRYVEPQFTRDDGKRDMRTTSTSAKKK